MVLTKDEARELVEQIWKQYDVDGSGTLEKRESEKLLKDIAIVCEDKSIFTQKEQILKFLDTDGDGKLSKDEIVDIIMGI